MKSRFIFPVLLAVVGVAVSSVKAKKSVSSAHTLKEFLITSDYDKGVIPSNGENATVIMFDIYVESFGKIEEVNMEFDAYIYLRQKWKDDRLVNSINNTVTLTREDIGLLWRPDTYCSNARKTDLDVEDKAMHSSLDIDPHGNFYYSRNTHVVASCDMDLHNFPIDTQNCSLQFGSYAFPTKDVDYMWEKDEIIVAQPIMAQFSIIASKVKHRVDEYTSGNYTVVEVSFLLQRRLGYYMIQLYLPCIFLVMLSWIVFWMSCDNGGDRLTVGITCILTIVFLLGYVNAMLPKVSYVKGVDWYLMTSFLFIFLSLVECVFVERWSYQGNHGLKVSKDEGQDNQGMASSPASIAKFDKFPSSKSVTVAEESQNARNRSQSFLDGRPIQVLPLSQVAPPPEGETTAFRETPSKPVGCLGKMEGSFFHRFKCEKERNRPEKVDLACRVLFPLTYALYNTAYWYVYLNGVDLLA